MNRKYFIGFATSETVDKFNGLIFQAFIKKEVNYDEEI